MSHLLQDVPDFSTFVRDQLAEHLDGLGHDVTATDERDGFPCLTVETWDGATWADVAVTSDGRTMSMVDGWTEVRLRGFTWQPMPTDTGSVHGPRAFPTAEHFASIPIPARFAFDAWWSRRVGSHRVAGTTRTV